MTIDRALLHTEREYPPCYFLARRMVGVPTLREYVRTAWGGAVWMGVLPLTAAWAGRHNKRRLLHAIERRWAHGLLRHLRVRLVIEGVEQIQPNTAYVVASLHEGFGDVPALLHLPLTMRFAARDELFDWRVFGRYLHDAGHVYVAPEQGSRAYRRLLREARAIVGRGESLAIFPQGTILGIESDFMLGAFALAKALRRPLLPVALTGSHRVWEYPYTPRLRYDQRMSMRVLPPISAETIARTDAETLRVSVQEMLKGAALDGTMAPPRHFVPQRDGYWDGYAYRIDPAFPELAAHIEWHRETVAAQHDQDREPGG